MDLTQFINKLSQTNKCKITETKLDAFSQTVNKSIVFFVVKVGYCI